jgi:putative RecB family exonuclease
MEYKINMNNIYSYSRLEAFRQCPLKYKYQYIDGIKRKTKSIEAFMGSCFHKAMELLYKDIRFKLPAASELVDYYNEQWDDGYSDDITIVKKQRIADDYRKIGIEAINSYYKRYYPFRQSRVLGIEKAFVFNLDNDGKYRFRAIIDRIGQAEDSVYEIHDYKTSSSIFDQQQADRDIQLALYQIALEKMWHDVEKVRLVWHFVAFDKEVISFRSSQQLESVLSDTRNLIDKIESTKSFPHNESALCAWCSFQEICPVRKHLFKLEQLPESEYKSDTGFTLVAKYTDLESQKSALKKDIDRIEQEQEKIKQAAIGLAEKERISVIDGPTSRLKIEQKQELRPPSKTENSQRWEDLRAFLIQEGKYEEVSTVNFNMFNHALKNRWHGEFAEKVKIFLTETVSKIVRLVKK